MPGSLNKLKLFEDKLPLFNRFQIENQIESAFSREVNLPSGGAIVIDHTEALTSIDVNSARATRGADIEETAKMTNLEAADEIARQLRIRDLGGLIVIDFIDMLQNKNQREVESRLRKAVYDDRARVQIGRISRFGLLEMSRQRLRPSLEESSQIVCPRCSGQGTIRDVESLSLAVLRLLEEESLKDNTGKILAKIPVECATYLLNEKREKIDALEQRREVHIVVIPDPRLETPHYVIERVRDNDTHRHESNYKKSYELVTEDDPVDLVALATSSPVEPEKAAVQRIAPSGPRPAERPMPAEPTRPGLFTRLFGSLFGGAGEAASEADKQPSRESQQGRDSGRGRRGKYRGGQKNRQRGGNTANKQAADKATDAGKRDGAPDKDNAARKEAGDGQDNRRGQRSGRSRGGNRSGNRGNRGGRQPDNAVKQQNADDADARAASAEQDGGKQEPGNKSGSRRKSGSKSSSRRRNGGADKPARAGAENGDSAPGVAEPGNDRQPAADGNQDSSRDRGKPQATDDADGNRKAAAGTARASDRVDSASPAPRQSADDGDTRKSETAGEQAPQARAEAALADQD